MLPLKLALAVAPLLWNSALMPARQSPQAPSVARTAALKSSPAGLGSGITVTLFVLAIAFGLVNGFIRPIARLVSIPLDMATLGLFSVVLNALLLMLVAFGVDILVGPLIVIGGFPPELSLGAIGAAAVGSVVISAISAALTILIPDT